MRHKVWAIHLCYNEPEIIERSIQQYIATSSPEIETIHVFVDQHWPLFYASFAKSIRALASEIPGSIVLDPGKNLGLHEGFNWALSQLPIPDNAGVIGYDPDSWPVTPGWDLAMCRTFVRDSKAAWISLWHPHAQRELIEEGKGLLLGYEVLVKRPVMNSVCMFRMEWLRKCGGLTEQLPYYGGLEIHQWARLEGWKWIFLCGFVEDFWPWPDMVNVNYREWKWATTHGREQQIEFGAWLRKKGLS